MGDNACAGESNGASVAIAIGAIGGAVLIGIIVLVVIVLVLFAMSILGARKAPAESLMVSYMTPYDKIPFSVRDSYVVALPAGGGRTPMMPFAAVISEPTAKGPAMNNIALAPLPLPAAPSGGAWEDQPWRALPGGSDQPLGSPVLVV